jgi:hypothetical protein
MEIRLRDLAASTNFIFVEPYKGDDGSAATFRAECRICLRVPAFGESCASKHVSGNDITLSTAAVYACLKHIWFSPV